jgi:flagellar basal-body rod protein FlgB
LPPGRNVLFESLFFKRKRHFFLGLFFADFLLEQGVLMFPSFAMFNQEAMPTLERAASFSEQRQKVIANNIANAETPHYLAQDLPGKRFQLRLKEAILNRRYGNPRYYSFRDDRTMHDSGGSLRISHDDNKLGLLRHSKNNVDIDMENAKMAKNAMFYTSITRLMNQQFSQLQAAIRGSF